MRLRQPTAVCNSMAAPAGFQGAGSGLLRECASDTETQADTLTENRHTRWQEALAPNSVSLSPWLAAYCFAVTAVRVRASALLPYFGPLDAAPAVNAYTQHVTRFRMLRHT